MQNHTFAWISLWIMANIGHTIFSCLPFVKHTIKDFLRFNRCKWIKMYLTFIGSILTHFIDNGIPFFLNTFSTSLLCYLGVFFAFSIFAGTISSSLDFQILEKRNEHKKNGEKIKLTRINQSRCVLIHVLCSALVFAFVFINVGKRFIIVHGNYVECSRLVFFFILFFCQIIVISKKTTMILYFGLLC